MSFDRSTGSREIVRPGLDGFLVPDDGEAFGEAAASPMTDAGSRRRTGEAARDDRRRRFSAEGVIGLWHDSTEAPHGGRAAPGSRAGSAGSRAA